MLFRSKRNLSIPQVLRNDGRLMRHLCKGTSCDRRRPWVLQCQSEWSSQVSSNSDQGECWLSNRRVGKNFLRSELGISFLRRTELVAHDGWGISHQHILQISRSEDIDVWRREIGFSNPSHISRMIVFESLGECIPRTSIDRKSVV